MTLTPSAVRRNCEYNLHKEKEKETDAYIKK